MQQERTITHDRLQRPTAASGTENEAGGDLLAQSAAFVQVARQNAEACKKKESAQQELERRRTGPGQ